MPAGDLAVKRHWNTWIWAGFVLAIVALASYFTLFLQFAATRDVPWVNYLLFACSGVLLTLGIRRAYRDPEHYRGKVAGPILAGLSALAFGAFIALLIYTKQLPPSQNARRVGETAPAFELSDTAGQKIALADLLKQNRGVVLIFYRGYW